MLPLGAALVALIGVGQALHDGSELRIGDNTRLAIFVAVQMVACCIYMAAVAVQSRRPFTVRLPWVLAVAAAMRAIPLCSPMFLSSDLFRYIWDGRVQLAGINPYLYVPADEVLAHLRDTAIFSHVNRAMYARTIYPPMAELVFRAVAAMGQRPWMMRAAMVLFECLAMGALLAILRRCRLPSARVLIYAWNPLATWEFSGNGHVDAVAIGLVALALLGVALRRPTLAGAALGAAVLVKYLPAVLAPALWYRRDWRLPAAALLTCAALYALYAGAGTHLLGFLPGYAQEEGMQAGTGFWLLAGLADLIKLPPAAVTVYALAVLGVLATLAWPMLRRAQPPSAVQAARDAGTLIVATMVALSPHYPWYYPWASVPAAIAPQRSAIFLGCAAILLYLDPLHENFFWPALVFVPTIALSVWDRRSINAAGAV
jgi:hypothetical protein